MEWQPTLCIEVSPGAWTVTADPKYGKVTLGKEHIEAPRGECPGKLFTFATISYEWTAHNNKTISTTINDTFNATWATSDGFNIPFTFDIKVPVVRPASETTEFVGWVLANGQWRGKLHPPADDPTFDFSGEFVQEFAAAPAGPDTCWFNRSKIRKFVEVTNKPGDFWTVKSGNVYGDDGIGYGSTATVYYRLNSPPDSTFAKTGSCGTRLGQQMKINAPPDPPMTYTTYGHTNTGNVNALGASIGRTTVHSKSPSGDFMRDYKAF